MTLIDEKTAKRLRELARRYRLKVLFTTPHSDAVVTGPRICKACLGPNEGPDAVCRHCGHNSNNDPVLGRSE